MRGYRFLPHTGDIQLEVWADSLSEVFLTALRGMDEILSPGFCQRKKKFSLVRTVSFSSLSTTDLLVDFLSQVLTLSYLHQAIFCHVSFAKLAQKSLKAKLWGRLKAKFRREIKAVTYYQAEVRKEKNFWKATLIFDI